MNVSRSAVQFPAAAATGISGGVSKLPDDTKIGGVIEAGQDAAAVFVYAWRKLRRAVICCGG